ncbi:C40 family peptidase [Pseudarthrobacter sp. MDT1-22]
MTTRATVARHRAEVAKTNSLAVIAKAVGDNAGGMGRQAAVIAAASGLVLTSGIAANAADTGVQREAASASNLEAEVSAPAIISAASTIAISYEKPAVTTTPAPIEAPAPVVEAPAPAPAKAAATLTVASATPAAPKAPVSASGKGQAILSAAYAQLGVSQDCTMLVTNSLAAVGINFRDWPAGYLSLGQTVSAAEAQPGDLLYYADGGAGVAHIAVYAGNGQAVHGGYNGNQTVVFSANVGSGPVYIRVS